VLEEEFGVGLGIGLKGEKDVVVMEASSATEEENWDMQGVDWWKKVESFLSAFRKRAQEAIYPGRDVTIDELLIKAYGRSPHTLQIPSKAAGKGYKIYAMCILGYLWDCFFTSRISGIVGVPKGTGDERATSVMIITLMHTLPNRGRNNCVWLDNFFTTGKLFSRGLLLTSGVLPNASHQSCGSCEPPGGPHITN
jgi:Transposase IS4